MVDPHQAYEALKYWLPIVTVITLVVKAYINGKKNIGAWADKLLNNHLSHIEDATTSTEIETKKTNELLFSAALKNNEVANKVADVKSSLDTHHEKEAQVWQGVLNTLTVLEDRTRRSKTTRRR